MASNDSGLDSSNDSNDGGTSSALVNPELQSPSTICSFTPPHHATNSKPSTSTLNISSSTVSSLPPLPPNITATVASAAAQSWHNINPKAFHLNINAEEFVQPYLLNTSKSIRYSSLPSSSHSYKMRLRAKQRLASAYPGILAECKGRRLRTAASSCNIDMLNEILESGFDPNASDEYKRSPLHLASCRGYIEIVKQLLKFGANPNLVDSLGNTPLHLAVISASSNNFNVVVQVLLHGGASIHIHDRNGKTPLDLAESKLRLLRARHSATCEIPEISKTMEDMCLLIALLMRYFVKQREDLDNLTTLEQKLQNLSTADEPIQDTVLSQAADALLASVEQLSIGK